MTDTEATGRDIITRDDAGQPQALATLPPGSMAQFLPKSVSELAHVAKFAADVGMFGVNRQGVAFNIMLAGAHLGLTPYASLEGITLINGRPVVSAQVQWTLILSRGRVTDHNIDSTDTYCKITVHSQKWRSPKSEQVTIEDVPKKLADKATYKDHPADMLFAFCVRRLRKRYFPEVMVGALDSGEMESVDADAVTVVDVGTVQEHLGEAAMETPPCAKQVTVQFAHGEQEQDCGQPTELVPGRSGGMFLRCTQGHMMPPPQAVRDAIRGHREGLAAIQQGGEATAGVSPDQPVETAPPPEVIDDGAGASRAAPGDTDEFREAAGLPEREYSRAEVDDKVQAIISTLTALRKTARLNEARSIIQAYGWDNAMGLTSWLSTHPGDLDNIADAIRPLSQPEEAEPALPL